MPLTRRAALSALAAASVVPAAASAQTRWQMATPYPDGNFHTINIREFLKEVEQATGGKLAVQVHSNASLLPQQGIKRGVQQGQVQMGEILLSAYANEDPMFDADSLPFLVADLKEAKRLSDLHKPFVEARFQRQGLSLLYMVGWPPGGFYTQVPLTGIDVLKGSRFRTFNAMSTRFATLVGANPVQVQQAELAQAFATGIATAMVTSAQTGVDTSAWDYAKVFTPANFTMTKNAVFVSRRALDGLPKDQGDAIRAAAAKAEERGWRMSEEATAAAEKRLAERGLTIGTVPPDVKEAFRKIGETMAEEWVAKVGDDGRKLLDSLRAAR
ncbi:TRAP transporter substrate-binding protein DctP [Craurococcus roseus]|uniref:TRAP transporter substrate-binding protein DctP n=1 Tax=Craurococcus roseus TaxID=77585 RepID=A0ABN1FIT8_9PROT